MDLLRPATIGAACVLLALAACAHRRDREIPARGAPTAAVDTLPLSEPTAAASDPDLPDVSTDRANADDPGAGTATRRASQRVVEEGKGYLIAGHVDAATERFERALRIDPTNGFAYFYLGRTRVETGDLEGALGMLDKADSLLGPYPVWRDRVARLQAAIERSMR